MAAEWGCIREGSCGRRSIRGFEGAAGGVIRWVRIVNDTAVAVDQLGVRAGAAAVYLDAWHRDLPEFLQLRTNNGDERMKAMMCSRQYVIRIFSGEWYGKIWIRTGI